MRRHLGLFAGFCFAFAPLFGQFSLSPSTVNFFTVTKGSPDSISVTLTNTKPVGDLVVTDVHFYHPETFYVKENQFTLAPSQSKSFWVYCNPRHNVRYLDWMMVETSTEATVPASFVFAQGKFPLSYYDGTQNKWDEDLEATLKSLLAFGYTDLGYNGARDEIFMHLDNAAYNGQGATQNTLECIYTGVQAIGYTSRTDCQTNYNFNTEHTVPQSLFSQSPPMVSDMHHLWPTDANANSERGDNPFGTVTNPSWSVGGSKSNGSVFEPRDVSKGKIARAVLYFALRYQDYNNFIAPQETNLRNWCNNFLPTAAEVTRNDDIQVLQKNRNPFTDHPEFLERITLLVGTGNRAPVPTAYVGDDTLIFNAGFPGTTTGYFLLSNQGLDTLSFSNVTFSSPDFSLGTVSSFDIAPDSVRKVYVQVNPSAGSIIYDETAVFNTNDPTKPSMTVHLIGESIVTGVASGMEMRPVLSPNPARDLVQLRWQMPVAAEMAVQLRDLSGKLIRETAVSAGSSELGMKVDDIGRGCYFLSVEGDGLRHSFKVILQ